MINSVVIPLPLALLVIAAMIAACWFANRLLAQDAPEYPVWTAPETAPAAGRHHLGAVAEPYRPRPATALPGPIEAPAAPAHTWTPEEIDMALEAAEMAATEQLLSEIAATEAAWVNSWTDRAALLAESRWDDVPTSVLVAR
jgi:hypothetical protein